MGEAAARLPKQHRSRRTLQRIARAALELIGQNGVEGTTVGAIARRAGSSVGSFYARFDGKGDLLLYLDERIWETVEQQWSEALADGLSDRPIHELVRGLARLYADLDHVHRGARDAIGRALRGPGAGPSDAALRIRERVREDSQRLLLTKRGAPSYWKNQTACGTGLLTGSNDCVLGLERRVDGLNKFSLLGAKPNRVREVETTLARSTAPLVLVIASLTCCLCGVRTLHSRDRHHRSLSPWGDDHNQ